MKVTLIKILIVVLLVLQVISVALSAIFGMISVFSALGSLIAYVHPIEVSDNIRIYTHAGFALVMLICTLLTVIVYFVLDYFRRVLKYELK